MLECDREVSGGPSLREVLTLHVLPSVFIQELRKSFTLFCHTGNTADQSPSDNLATHWTRRTSEGAPIGYVPMLMLRVSSDRFYATPTTVAHRSPMTMTSAPCAR